MEGQSNRIEQAEDRISELEDEIVIKGKTKVLLNNTRPVKRICKKLLTPSKDKPEKQKRCKQRECVLY
jgi:hypothetical protein